MSKSIKIIIGSVLINTALSAKRGLGTFGCKTILLRMVIVAERIKNMNMLRSHQDTHMAYHLIPTNLRYSFFYDNYMIMQFYFIFVVIVFFMIITFILVDFSCTMLPSENNVLNMNPTATNIHGKNANVE